MKMSRIVLVIVKFQLLACVLALRDGLLSALDKQNTRAKQIINGVEVTVNEIRYQVLLYRKTQHIDDYHCGGSLISMQYVLTAAYCVLHENNTFFEQPLIIVVGITDYRADNIEQRGVEVEKVYVPNDFEMYENNTISDADIAILKLKHILRFPPRRSQLPRGLTVINLPAANTKVDTYEGVEALITGFGYDDIECDSSDEDANCAWVSSGKLKKMHVRVIVNESLGCTPSKDYICAVTDPRYEWGGSCHGDSGGPLVYKNTAIGVLSDGPDECDQIEKPDTYTRVSSFIDFIKNAMKDIDTPDMRVHSWK